MKIERDGERLWRGVGEIPSADSPAVLWPFLRVTGYQLR